MTEAYGMNGMGKDPGSLSMLANVQTVFIVDTPNACEGITRKI